MGDPKAVCLGKIFGDRDSRSTVGYEVLYKMIYMQECCDEGKSCSSDQATPMAAI